MIGWSFLLSSEMLLQVSVIAWQSSSNDNEVRERSFFRLERETVFCLSYFSSKADVLAT